MLDPHPTEVPAARTPQSATLLIVDDDEDIRTLLRHQLGRRSQVHVVGEASDGVEAVWACREMHPDIVILDVEMPNTNGLAALEAIKTVSPTSDVVMYSARDDRHTRETAQRLGAAAFVAKGGGRNNLLEALDRVHRTRNAVPSPRMATQAVAAPAPS